MRKLLFAFVVLLLPFKAYATPNNSMSITPVAVDGATITASDENSRNNVVSAAYNAHDHNDIDQTANTLNVGDAAAGNKTITAYNADTNKPFLRYDDTNNYWIVSTDGVAPSVVLQGTGAIFEGTTDDAFETTFSITDPTADRTQTVQNNSGVLPLGTAGNTLFLTTTGATNVTLPTSGTLVTTAGAGVDIDIGSYELRAQTLQSDVVTGTAPLIVASTTKVTNLNADLLDGQTGSYYSSLSNVIFAWNGSDNASTNDFGMVEGSSLTPTMSTYTANYHFFGTSGLTSHTILESKFIKIATISTITVNAKLWASNLGGANDAILNVDIGGQSTEIRSTADDTPTWQPSSNIDVSGLSNGTTYTITISIACEAGTSAYCSAIILTAS